MCRPISDVFSDVINWVLVGVTSLVGRGHWAGQRGQTKVESNFYILCNLYDCMQYGAHNVASCGRLELSEACGHPL